MNVNVTIVPPLKSMSMFALPRTNKAAMPAAISKPEPAKATPRLLKKSMFVSPKNCIILIVLTTRLRSMISKSNWPK